MKRNFLLLTICLLSAKLLCSQIFMCSDPTAWNYDPDAESDPADSTYCLYFEDCQESTVQRYLEVYGGFIYFGTEFHVITTDLQDTLGSYVYSAWGWGGTGFDRNVWSICVDPDECYFLDIRLPEPLPYFGLFIWAHSSYPLDYYDQFSVPTVDEPTDHYRVFFAAENAAPCGQVGCMDPLAENYNSFATYNFGCMYCQESGVKVSADFTFNGNTPWQIRNEEGIVASGSFSEDSPQLTELACLDTGCYEFRIYGDDYHFNEISLFTFEDSLLTTMTLTEDSEAIFPFGIGVADCSDPDQIYGCTNPLGMNYDPEATVDDGSCDLQNDECGISLEAYLDSSEEFLIIDPDFYTTDYPVTILWDMGDGTDVFDEGLGDTYLYDTTGVFTVCATIYSWQFFENLPLCYSMACIEIDAFEFGFSEGFPVFLSDGTVSTEEVSFAKELLFYPNPSSDIVRVSGVKGFIDRLRVFSLDGRRIDVDLKGDSSAQPHELNISSLTNGTYLISIESAGSFYTGKLVVAK